MRHELGERVFELGAALGAVNVDVRYAHAARLEFDDYALTCWLSATRRLEVAFAPPVYIDVDGRETTYAWSGAVATAKISVSYDRSIALIAREIRRRLTSPELIASCAEQYALARNLTQRYALARAEHAQLAALPNTRAGAFQTVYSHDPSVAVGSPTWTAENFYGAGCKFTVTNVPLALAERLIATIDAYNHPD